MDDDYQTARISSEIAEIYTVRSQWTRANEYFEKACKLYQNTGDSNAMADCCKKMGYNFKQAGDFEQAVPCYEKALALYEISGNTDEIINMHINISIVHMLWNHREKAGEILFSTLKDYQSEMDSFLFSKLYMNIGNYYYIHPKLDSAEFYYSLALKYTDTADKIQISGLYNNLGNINLGKQDYEQALQYYIKSRNIWESGNNSKQLALVFTNIAHVYRSMEKYDSSAAYYSKGFQLAEQNNDRIRKMQIFYELHELYKEKKAFETSLDYLTNFILLKDSVFSEKSEKRLQEMEVRYESAKKEQEILKKEAKNQRLKIYFTAGIFLLIMVLIGLYLALSRRKNKYRAELHNYMLQALNQQINPHFVFNSLNSIQYYIAEHNTIASHAYIESFSCLIRNILENTREHLTPVQNEIETLEAYLKLECMRFDSRFSFRFQIDENLDTLMYKTPSLLIQPFVENAVWHGLMHKQGKGLLLISVLLQDNEIHWIIDDNGIGREKAKTYKAERMQKKASMGNEITRKRIRILKALYKTSVRVSYTDKTDDKGEPLGTKVQIIIPLLK